MLLLALSALAASAQPAALDRAPPSAPIVRATGRATVTILAAAVVPMSTESFRHVRQRPTRIRLADGEHQAIIVEFE